MQIIKLEDKIIYRADKGKKVKWIFSPKLYSEISVSEETDQIEEVTPNE